MRIIAGEFRGRRLHSPRPKNFQIRPTTDMVRESVFNIIADRVQGARVLDLFAGTGAMGMEALSRGAQSCLFVDNGAKAVRIIRENVQLCEVQHRSRIIQAKVSSAIFRLRSEGELFDLIFMDPPYRKGYIEKTLQIISPVANEDSLVIAERHIKGEPPMVPVPGWQKKLDRRYGDTLISIYSRLTIL
ncbi:MAG TPA: 16S rRNA (guanine(966)-N(2))-methyltransferase RsmD [Syntrophobacteraceae bacterium]|nr:16S rRNA (guanine(966)-N(2))-methyltransferase RsmD [Syntrophobacteraceae bacterium]